MASEIRRHKRVTGLTGVYAAGCRPLLFLFAGAREAASLETLGLILAITGIAVDVVAARHSRRLTRRPEGEAPPSPGDKKLWRRQRAELMAFRVATLGAAVVCGLACLFGEAFMCWLHGPGWMAACEV